MPRGSLDPLTEYVYPPGQGYSAEGGRQPDMNSRQAGRGPGHGVCEIVNEWQAGLDVRATMVTVGDVAPQVNRPGYGGGPGAPVGPFAGRTLHSWHTHDTNRQIVDFNGGAHIIAQYLVPTPGAQNPQVQSASTSPNRPAPPFGQVVIGPFAQHPGYQ